jgi:hypothetical protein
MKLVRDGVLAAVLAMAGSSAGCDTPGEMAGAQVPAGGSATQPPPTSPPRSEGTDSVPGVPTFACGAPLGALTIDLPCQVGYPLGAQSTISAVECTVHSASASGKISFLLPLGQLAQQLNRATDLADFPAAPIYAVKEQTLKGLAGKVVFSAVDVRARAFLGRFAEASLTFSPGETVCRIHDGLFWAVPGEFL